jgi:hypothetical protein
MFELIVFIFFMYMIFRNIKKKADSEGKTAQPNVPRKSGQDELSYSTQDRAEFKRAEIKTPEIKRAEPKREQTVRASASSAIKKTAPVQENRMPEGQQSTTELLRQKAEEDEKSHRLEQWEQKRKEQQSYGNLHYAGRYLLGDEVPKNQRIVICGYCNAENLIPVNKEKSRYNCYFCREKL